MSGEHIMIIFLGQLTVMHKNSTIIRVILAISVSENRMKFNEILVLVLVRGNRL